MKSTDNFEINYNQAVYPPPIGTFQSGLPLDGLTFALPLEKLCIVWYIQSLRFGPRYSRG